jgi:hypothetical protein
MFHGPDAGGEMMSLQVGFPVVSMLPIIPVGFHLEIRTDGIRFGKFAVPFEGMPVVNS